MSCFNKQNIDTFFCTTRLLFFETDPILQRPIRWIFQIRLQSNSLPCSCSATYLTKAFLPTVHWECKVLQLLLWLGPLWNQHNLVYKQVGLKFGTSKECNCLCQARYPGCWGRYQHWLELGHPRIMAGKTLECKRRWACNSSSFSKQNPETKMIKAMILYIWGLKE